MLLKYCIPQHLEAHASLLKQGAVLSVHQLCDVVSEESYDHHEDDDWEEYVVSDSWIDVERLLHIDFLFDIIIIIYNV
jgi:hypothetical protein